MGESTEVAAQVTGLKGDPTFSLENNPAWLAIDPRTGLITAAPALEDVAAYPGVVVVATSDSGESAEISLGTFEVPTPPLITSFSAARTRLVEGETTQLQWSTDNAESVALAPGVGQVESDGAVTVTPAASVDYILSATSAEGQVVSASLPITVSEILAVELRTSIARGPAPLTVSLTPIVNTQNAANRLYWDFEGDGGAIDGGLGTDGASGFDPVVSLLSGDLLDYDSTSRSQLHTFEQPGTYNVRLRLWDALGNQIDASTQIEVLNAAPDVSVSADVTNGEVPLAVQFQIIAADNEGIAEVRWDFDGNGSVDSVGPELTTTHVFNTTGDFQVAVTVVDSLGAEQSVSAPNISIRARPAGSASVDVSASPLAGDAPLNVTFSGRASAPSGVVATAWQWDFDGDGSVDATTETGRQNHLYSAPGQFFPRITVQFDNGDSALDIEAIDVAPDLTLSVASASFDPEAEQAAVVHTTLSGSYSVQLEIIDQQGALVRTLVPWTTRADGEYDDAWDGRSDAGEVLAPGAYFVLLRYRVGDVERLLDLRQSTAGRIFYPGGCSRGLSGCGTMETPTYELEPFNFQPWVYRFQPNFIAEFTANISIYTTDELMNTFFARRPFGTRLNNEIVWNGEDADGTLLPQAPTRYLINLFGETLGDNAIYLDHGVRLQNFRAEPAIYFPLTGAATLRFDLSRPARLEMWVVDANGGGEVFRQSLPRREAGAALTLTWEGRNNAGVALAPGAYRISLRATDDYGYQSIPIHAMQRIRY